MPKVYIIVLNYNSGKDIHECLESLKDISYENYHIFVVDNNSTDNSPQKIKEFIKKYPKLPTTYYSLPTNYGFAGGNNRGIKKALEQGADYALILNPDTVVDPDFLDKLVEVAENWKKNGKLAFFGPRILLHASRFTLHASRIYSNGGIINWSQTKGMLKDYGKLASELVETKAFETQYVTGTCLLVSKEIIGKIGLMREDYFLYYEDTDWAIRARKQGIAQVIVPQSVIWHKVSRSTKAGSFSYIYYHTRNGLYCGWNNGNAFQKMAIIGMSKFIFFKQLIKLAIPSKRVWAKAVMRGVCDFWRGIKGKHDET